MEIKRIYQEDCIKYHDILATYIFQSVKNSMYEEKYSMQDANRKCEELWRYLGSCKAIVFGAFDDKELIGFVWAYEYPYRDDTSRVYVSILHVDECYRGKSIGKQLLYAIEEEAKRRGFRSIFLHAEAKNEGAIRFYNREGYRRERVQLVKMINEQYGGPRDVLENEKILVYLLKCNIQSHKFMESFSYEDGLMKIRGLGEYLKKEQAIAYAYKIMKKIEGFLWVYPHKYNGEKRFYLSVIVVSEK